jgi:hypothetical protein
MLCRKHVVHSDEGMKERSENVLPNHLHLICWCMVFWHKHLGSTCAAVASIKCIREETEQKTLQGMPTPPTRPSLHTLPATRNTLGVQLFLTLSICAGKTNKIQRERYRKKEGQKGAKALKHTGKNHERQARDKRDKEGKTKLDDKKACYCSG